MLFSRRTQDEYADSLAAYMPGGRLFKNKTVQDSNFRKLLRGLAGELFKVNGYLKQYADDIIPDQTERFIDEWESAVGIPDGCFDGNGDLTTRRTNVLTKLAALGVQTAEDFEALALVFGKTVDIFPLSQEALPPYGVPFNPVGLPSARFIIVVEGVDIAGDVPPYDVPFPLGVGESVLECVFKRLKPANCDIIFRNSN